MTNSTTIQMRRPSSTSGVVVAEAPDVDPVVLDVVAEAEWGRGVGGRPGWPSPTALAEAATATAAVIRRTRDIARSRFRIAG